MLTIRRVVMAAIGMSVLLALTGCFPPVLSAPHSAAPTATPAGSAAPSGWAQFPHCSGAPNDPWVWVDDYPIEAFDAAGIAPICADTWVEADGETFLGVMHPHLTLDDIDALGAGLEDLGYVALVDDFDPTAALNAYAGARDYYLDGSHGDDFTRLAIEIYVNPVGGGFTAYIDFLSPQTRALG